jgi:hypothetical protein
MSLSRLAGDGVKESVFFFFFSPFFLEVSVERARKAAQTLLFSKKLAQVCG